MGLRTPPDRPAEGVTAYDSVMVGHIVQALRRLGGESHRRFMIEHILSEAGANRQVESLTAAIVACFERHCSTGQDPDALFRRPFGADSHRWSLGPGAMRAYSSEKPER